MGRATPDPAVRPTAWPQAGGAARGRTELELGEERMRDVLKNVGEAALDGSWSMYARHMDVPRIFGQRSRESAARLDELRRRVSDDAAAVAPAELAVFCAGSYARLEASEHSDVDLFFVYGPGQTRDGNRVAEIQFFSRLVDVVEEMAFARFSNDGQYLQTMTCDEVHRHLGSPVDDAQNLFTMRMLMLLESRFIHGQSTFENVQRSIISAYYRDYPDHQSSFEPWFLLNDIGRFWKTLLLNYENKRNQRPDVDSRSEDNELRKTKQKVKNFKLKYSRMTTCFATVGALASFTEPIKEEDVFDLIQLTPQQRLLSIADRVPRVESEVERVLESYAWFLEQTAQTEEQLLAGFAEKELRQERFDKANSYGDLMFALIRGIARVNDEAGERLLRFLVI
jgi:predicted nucleotidyltransferase